MRLSVLVLALGLAGLMAAPAQAQAQSPGRAWRVGDAIVMRTTTHALAMPAGEAWLLETLEKSAARLCRDTRPRRVRDACETAIITETAATAAPVVQAALERALAARHGRHFAAAPAYGARARI